MELEDKMNYFVKEVNLKIKNTTEQQLNTYQESLEKDFQNFKRKVDASYSDRLEAEKNALRKENNKNMS